MTIWCTSDLDTGQPWYHGSDRTLSELRPGSSITQNRPVARVFSHRPAIVSQLADGTIMHDGSAPGYLYIVDEPVHPDDVYPHPHPINESRWEWLTKRPLRLALVERTEVQPDERLTDGEQVELRRRQIEAGEENFAARD
ncbi:MAG TPA: hypothetical protein DEV93_18295 [Chloroflexi bacterium]|nr:hypothetical protein [Chloroflexota bacterium]